MTVLISQLCVPAAPVEIVERKGVGHPDTICDALAEELSRNLCIYYREHFETVLHHNVDKVLLRGGSAEAGFGGGEVTEPIDIYLAGRATTNVGSDLVPVEQIAIEGSRNWLRQNLHALDAERHVRVHCLVRPGSVDLTGVFSRSDGRTTPLSNDTSIGVGFAPFSNLESLIMAAERHLTDHDRTDASPARGEDVKIMGVSSPRGIQLTVAAAMIGPKLEGSEDYERERATVASEVLQVAATLGLEGLAVDVNTADDPASGSYYLTVTGTSAESGDDGQVGRGNRVNGLITPYRPMTLEAAAGKNPVNHVGKLYSIVAQSLARLIVEHIKPVSSAECFLVSQIGKAITEPAFVDVRLATSDGYPVSACEREVQEIVANEMSRIPQLVDQFISGAVVVY
ncbi:MAG: methionine adenosyltransferase [Hyphomicrobiaceae bacterium]